MRSTVARMVPTPSRDERAAAALIRDALAPHADDVDDDHIVAAYRAMQRSSGAGDDAAESMRAAAARLKRVRD